MRKILILPVLALLFYSCNECRNLDCLPGNYTIYLRLLQQPGDKDLLFGSTAIYQQENIRFYTLNGTDTTYFQHTPARLPGSDHDSMLSVNLYPEPTSSVYMRLDAQDTDTLQAGFKRFDSQCCGVIPQIDSLKYNNHPTVSATEGTLELTK